MANINQTSQEDGKSKNVDSKLKKADLKKSQKTSSSTSLKDKGNEPRQEVLLKLPGGFEYKMPGKRQRVAVALIVVGLNVLLLIAVGLYFYVPAFKEFIYNVGR